MAKDINWLAWTNNSQYENTDLPCLKKIVFFIIDERVRCEIALSFFHKFMKKYLNIVRQFGIEYRIKEVKNKVSTDFLAYVQKKH